MRGRDLALLAGVVVVGAFAVVDAVRDANGDSDAFPRGRAESVARPQPAPQRQGEAPTDYPRGVLRGAVVFADHRDCTIRVLDVAGGRERTVPPLTACTFWVSPRGVAFAYRSEGRAIFLAGTPWGHLGTFPNLAGPVIWSVDGGRAAWCTRGGQGFEFDVVGHALAPEALNRCPAAYAPNGEPAFVSGGQILVDDRTIVETNGQILFVSGAANGTIAIVVATQPSPPNRLELWKGGRLVDAVEVAGRLGRWPPVFSPDNCAALFRDIDQAWFEVIALDCLEAERPDLLIFGNSRAVAWSPDGRWIAVAYSDRIGFHRVSDGEEVASWPVQATEIAWTAD